MANYEEQYPNLYHVNQNLAKTEELSEHNKGVLEEYFDRWRSRTDSASNSGFASRWKVIAPHIDFQIDEASRDDWRQVYKNLSRGEITKSNSDEKYAASTQKKFHKAFSTFYNNFIGQPGEGYNKELNGTAVVAGLNGLLEDVGGKKVKKETKPSASQVKEAASQLDTLRNRALLVFGWSVGARAGEIFRTQHKPQPLLWEDIRFNNDDTMTVHLRVNKKKSNKKTRRSVEVVVGKPLMKKLYDQVNPDKKDPVFKAERPKLKCPNCGNRVRRAADTQDEMDTSYHREYECKECGQINKRNLTK